MEINREILKSSGRIRRRKIFQFFSYLLLCVAFVFALTSFLFKLDRLQIKKVYISGNKNIESEKIFKVVINSLNSEYFGIYSKSNSLIYPKESIVSEIKKQFLWIRDVSISSVPGILSIVVIEREPNYLWCDDANKVRIERKCYYLDSDGFTFAVAPQFSGDVYLSFYGGNKRGGYMGRKLLESARLRSVIEVKDAILRIIELSQNNFGQPHAIFVYNNGDYDLIFSNGSLSRKITFDSSNVSVIENKLKATLESPFFKSEIKSPNKYLDYIDLRFGKKVFYKFHRR